MDTIKGTCHCGNVTFELDTEVARDDIVARACGCSFCRMQASRTWSDPNGHARIRVADATRLKRYRFGLKAIDFFLCAECGGYAGGVLSDSHGTWATLNLRLTDMRDAPEGAAHYDNQSGEEKVARRKRMWTPASVEGV